MNKTKFSWLMLGAVGVIISSSGCRGASMNPLSWWRSSSDPAVLADDSGSVPSPSETAMPVQQDNGPAATTASNYPNTGASTPYAASPYNGSGATASPYAASPVGASTPYGAPAANPIRTAGVPSAGGAATYAVPSPYSGAPQPSSYGQTQPAPSQGAGAAASPYGQSPYNQPAPSPAPYNQAAPSPSPYGQAAPYGQTPPATYGQPVPSSTPYGPAPSTTTYGQPSSSAPYGQAAPSSSQVPTGTYGSGTYGQPQQAPSTAPYSGAGVSTNSSVPVAQATSPSGVVQTSAIEGAGGNAVSTAPYLPGSTSRQSNVNPY